MSRARELADRLADACDVLYPEVPPIKDETIFAEVLIYLATQAAREATGPSVRLALAIIDEWEQWERHDAAGCIARVKEALGKADEELGSFEIARSRWMNVGSTRVVLSWDGPIGAADLRYAAGELGEPEEP